MKHNRRTAPPRSRGSQFVYIDTGSLEAVAAAEQPTSGPSPDGRQLVVVLPTSVVALGEKAWGKERAGSGG